MNNERADAMHPAKTDQAQAAQHLALGATETSRTHFKARTWRHRSLLPTSTSTNVAEIMDDLVVAVVTEMAIHRPQMLLVVTAELVAVVPIAVALPLTFVHAMPHRIVITVRVVVILG